MQEHLFLLQCVLFQILPSWLVEIHKLVVYPVLLVSRIVLAK